MCTSINWGSQNPWWLKFILKALDIQKSKWSTDHHGSTKIHRSSLPCHIRNFYRTEKKKYKEQSLVNHQSFFLTTVKFKGLHVVKHLGKETKWQKTKVCQDLYAWSTLKEEITDWEWVELSYKWALPDVLVRGMA